MNSLLRSQSILLALIYLHFNLQIALTIPVFKGNSVTFSDDFHHFLDDLQSKVYKNPANIPPEMEDIMSYTSNITSTTTKTQGEYNTINKNEEKDAIRDALMMKLVSYYEGKYRLPNKKAQTTVSPPLKSNVKVDYGRYHRHPMKIDIDNFFDIPAIENSITYNKNRNQVRRSNYPLGQVVVV